MIGPIAAAAANFCNAHPSAQECIELARNSAEMMPYLTDFVCLAVGFFLGVFIERRWPPEKKAG